jgi:hypothetical protein
MAVSAAAVLCLAVPGPTVHAQVQPWGSVLVKSSGWAPQFAAMGDLNVYSNGDGNEDRMLTYGESYECVELAARWAAVRYGEQIWWSVDYAYQMWDRGPKLKIPFNQLPNGGTRAPQFGDLVVFAPGPSNGAGHVAVVSGTRAGFVDIVEQNWNNANPTGRASLPIDGTHMPDRAGMPVIGWLRSSTEMTGYWLLGGDGGVFPYGTAGGFGSTGNLRLNKPVVGMSRTADGRGYWLVAGDGGIFPFGDAAGLGSTGGIHLNKPILAMTATPSGNGYWLVARDGGIFPFGDAAGYGSTGNLHLNQPIVGMAATPSGKGYWLVARDGGIFPFGDAAGYGSTGNIHLNQPIVGMGSTVDGKGYWLVAADGGVFNFGDAHGYGSAGGITLPAPIVSMTVTPSGGGYWMAGADGAVYNFGDAELIGSMAGAHLNAPVIDMAAMPGSSATTG